MSAVSTAEAGTALAGMSTEQVHQVVQSRYGAFAETGGHQEPC
ncbi:MAG TPA: hypothetical protein VET24_12040 [Actinomycetota bacterium]|nr:hypothetical protein [Actinomycetota bacterium]